MSAVLTELQSAVKAAADAVGPSTVGLGRGWGRGSGVVIAPNRVLTGAHVLRSDELHVIVGGGEPRAAKLLGADPDLDVAVLEADTGDAPAVAWDPSVVEDVAIGTAVIALADPGGRGLRASLGFVTATGRSFRGPRGRRVRGSIEHSAPLPRGSSGGPVVDAEHRLLGISAVRVDGGLILAVPADATLRQRVDALARGERVKRPRLGIALAPPRAGRRMRSAVGLPERPGLLVRAVAPGSPAAAAGIERGDLVVAVAGREVASLDELYDALDTSEPGATIQIQVVRGLDEREVSVTFGEDSE